MGRASKFLVLFAVSFGIGCESLLGSFEVSPEGASAIDAGAIDSQAPSQQSAQQDGGGDAGIVRACEQATDCPALAMLPAACATAECRDKVCVYLAVDKDGDGHPMAGCSVDGHVVAGDDCADDDPSIAPGGACTKRPDGSDIVFPNGTPLGACRAGKWDCTGGVPSCKGAVEPALTENCQLKNDANCDGVPDDGCDCTPNSTGPCGNVGNLPLPCAKGTRTCSPDGKWGDCIGNVEPMPRDCSSNLDNDCNGQADQGENACNCTGGVAQGKQASCTVPGKQGQCADGTWTCMPSPDKQSGVFGPCTGPKPAARNCASALDFDCNGVGDELEVACGSPCLDPLGTRNKVAATQKFSSSMWGCPGKRNHSVRAAACTTGFGPCSGATWEKYSATAGARRPTRKYWVNEALGYGGSAGACWADSTLKNCGVTSMSVCPLGKNGGTVTDPDGNTCNWTNCGYGLNDTTNDFFGGCLGNETAGTLCCGP